MRIGLLYVKWSDSESCTYWCDKDRYSKAHCKKDCVLLDGYCGTYRFDFNTNKVTLDTGAEVREVSVIEWKYN